MKKKNIIAFLVLAIIILLFPFLAHAQERSVQDILTQGLIQPPRGADYEISDFFLLLAAVLRLLFTGTAILAVIYVILGGYSYVTAYGNPEAAQKGKTTITWAVIGLIVSIISFALVQFTWNTISSGPPPSPGPATTTGSGTGSGGGSALGNINLSFSGDGNSITLNWSAPTGATHYTIYKDDKYISGQPNTTYKDSDVKAGQTYKYTVYAFDASEKQVGDAVGKNVTKTATGVTVQDAGKSN